MSPCHRNELARILASVDQKLERAKELLATLPIDSDRYARAVGRMAYLEGARLRVEGRLATSEPSR